MATPKPDGSPLQRSRSYDLMPPDMSELRLVLLGSKWSQRNSVGNFILGEDGFKNEAQSCVRLSRKVENKKITLINTPDLQFPTTDRLTEFIRHCAVASAPGPHLFLLVLQPENFTEEEKNRIYRVLTAFSDRSFDHSFVMNLKPRWMSRYDLMKDSINTALIKELIIKCRYRHLKMEETDLPELLTRFGQIVKENNGEHVRYEESEEPRSSLEDSHQNQGGKAATGSDDPSAGFSGKILKTHLSYEASGFRIMILGKSEEQKTKLGNLIIGEEEFHQQKFLQTKHSVAFSGERRGKPVIVVKTPDMFSLTEEKIQREMKKSVSLCYPGPNVLLLVKPSEFSEKNRETLKFIFSLFGQEAFRYSMIVFTHDSERSSSVNDLIRLVQGRCYNMITNDCSLLMTQIETIIDQNRGTYLTFRDEISRSQQEHLKPLNLVLFGPRDPLKAAAAKVILGHKDLPSECVRNQGEAFGRRVSVVELPALDGKAQQEVMEESFRCVSLCDPEGVHAFILVLPVGPLTDEDKGELHTIQDTFSSRVNDFTIILFTTDSDPEHPDVGNFIENKDIQDLLQICGGRYLVLDIRDRRQIEGLMETVERNVSEREKDSSYTTKTLAWGQMEEKLQLQNKLKKFESKTVITDPEQIPAADCLRIVLIGKTGCGKSSSGNTILGRREFEAKAKTSQQSITRNCQKAQTVIGGRRVVVVDTPGLFDNTLTPDQVDEELLKCISLLAPGPHVFLLVLQVDRFTEEEKQTLTKMKKVFGKNSEDFTLILFTGGDKLKNDEKTIEEYLREGRDESFKKVINDCGGRYHVFNNYDKQNRSQTNELIQKINNMVEKNRGKCFTSEMLQEAEAAIQREMKRILEEKEEEMKKLREELQKKHEEETESLKRKMEEQREEMERERKQREKQFKEMEENNRKEREQKEREQEEREKEEKKRKEEEERQQHQWEKKRQDLEKKIKQESEEKETIDRKLEEMRKQMEEKRDAWETERKEWWEKRHREDEERREELKRFQEKYEKEREKYENQRREDEERRREQEKERKELEEKYQKQLEEVKRKFEEEARKQAEEFNEFKQKYKKNFSAFLQKQEEKMKEKQQKEIREKLGVKQLSR